MELENPLEELEVRVEERRTASDPDATAVMPPVLQILARRIEARRQGVPYHLVDLQETVYSGRNPDGE